MKILEPRKPFLLEELEGDLFTPILIYQRLSGKKKFLLESSLKHENSGRYSFIGADPVMELKGIGDRTIIHSAKGEETIEDKPLEVLKTLMPENGMLHHDRFPFFGGAVGYVGYEAIAQYEQIGLIPADELGIPDVHLLFFEEVVIFDHYEQKVFLAATPLLKDTDISKLKHQLERIRKEIIYGTVNNDRARSYLSAFSPCMNKEEFIQKVGKAKAYIERGDIFQVVLSQRLQATIKGDSFSFYRKLRVKNPSPYMYYLDFGSYQIAGASPESLIRVNHGKVTANPIAGTRPRGKTDKEDQQLELDLLRDEKELAEHRMLLDLGRNDLGRVCEFGSIQIEKNMKVERFKHVMHLVSELSGKLIHSLSAIDAMVSCLPAGTVSGAPKIRAMEIINELEEVKRGLYAGAVGYFSAKGSLDFALAIRTMVIKDGKAYIQAGAGIVYDSIPEKEYEETLYKLKAFLEEQNDTAN
ncbi:anthranilate synthase component I [Cytobacillus praedii]|uniref:anthranilate synthase component I n=1 Tax=Cytobacillus praedii TaxID=1742358 RepID=UPI002E1DBC9F|nr:anthranilate synthase component I [Cytobacillus praedii]MED3553340.1 anthranilate synthase component I [Cytobacillus praedii]